MVFLSNCCQRESPIPRPAVNIPARIEAFNKIDAELRIPVYESYLGGLIQTKTPSPRWGRVLCLAKNKSRSGQIHSHIVAAIYNRTTIQGWYDDTPQDIAKKCCVLIPGHLILMAVETLFHATLLGAVSQICYGIANDLEYSQIALNCGRSMVDSARAPLYRLAAAVITVANLILPLIKTSWTYDLRNLQANIIHRLHWESRNCTAPRSHGYYLPQFFNSPICFQPQFLGYENDRVAFQHVILPQDLLLQRLGNLALGVVQSHESGNRPYTSPGLAPHEIAQAQTWFKKFFPKNE